MFHHIFELQENSGMHFSKTRLLARISKLGVQIFWRAWPPNMGYTNHVLDNNIVFYLSKFFVLFRYFRRFFSLNFFLLTVFIVIVITGVIRII